MKTLFALILAVTAAAQALPQPVPQATSPVKELNALIDDVDKTFASMKDFQAKFFQNSKNPLNQSQLDEGHLYLTRDKKMRVDYEVSNGKPEEKHYVSNGKTLFTYIPANRQVTQDPVKDSMVEQFPMMFLIGRSGLRKEFQKIDESLETKPLLAGDRVLRLTPNRKNQEIERIDIEVSPRTNLIDRMTVLYTDKSSTDFAFLDIEINRNIPASKFEFVPPPGIRVIQGSGTK
jgi:outer membrane lipoprotein carrier protein